MCTVLSMPTTNAVEEACATVGELTDRARDADLRLPTPCRDFDLRTLVNHFVGTTGALARAGRREPLDPEDPWGSRTDVADANWAGALGHNLVAIARAWSKAEAWQGSVDAGGNEMPAQMIGDTACMEVLLHGWDIAAATGQSLAVSAEVGAALLEVVRANVDLGRQMEAFGPEVPVPEDASDFDRALGLSGRHPGWIPST